MSEKVFASLDQPSRKFFLQELLLAEANHDICFSKNEISFGCHCLRWNLYKELIFERDNWTCKICGTKQKLVAHHKLPRAVKLDHSPTNLITYCVSCHMKYGLKMSDWLEDQEEMLE